MKPQLTKEAFAEWCDKQPADKEYDYWSDRNCACGQYAKHLGIEDWMAGIRARGIWLQFDGFAGDRPRTFGALAARLRA